jgi:hypothetical protein
MAHKLGGTHHVPHGLANALLISHVIRYNATDAPFKQTCFPQYAVPDALERYAEVADALCLGGKTKQEKVSGRMSLCWLCSWGFCMANSWYRHSDAATELGNVHLVCCKKQCQCSLPAAG